MPNFNNYFALVKVFIFFQKKLSSFREFSIC